MASATAFVLFCCLVCLVIAQVPTVTIAPGVEMPVVGLGSCCETYNVTDWIALGNRHIDTSPDYGSQPAVGAAIRASGIPRSEFFVTSKLNVENCSADVTAAVKQMVLEPLGLDYVDLLLLHHPGRWATDTQPRPHCFNLSDANIRGTYYTCRIETMLSFVKLQQQGFMRAFGVSNWEIRDLEQLYNVTGIIPSVNQIEFHPYWHTDDVIDYCEQHGITVEGYAPLANTEFGLLQNPALAPIAAAHNVSAAQVVLRWDMQKGAAIVIPRSQVVAHMAQNVDIFDFKLTPSEFASLDNFTQQKVYHTNCQPWC
eukprot:TRINITY_DN1138_c0_g1_i1.p1 TRINITY_DN1138_c0_g1~~TRINITY_DN1138_c0_g1_i1.p1  ORF type:complete len:312 (+),score=104.14 TRINITY_DN1138_c0_g1_i1:104-1039(+)